jgi:hypothetical protein
MVTLEINKWGLPGVEVVADSADFKTVFGISIGLFWWGYDFSSFQFAFDEGIAIQHHFFLQIEFQNMV